MKAIIEYADMEWVFKLLEIGGESIPTMTHGNFTPFASYLSVGLCTKPQGMTELYSLLYSLTADHFNGMIVALDGTDVKLTSWSVRLANDDIEDVIYVCKVGYKAIMPTNSIDYELKES